MSRHGPFAALLPLTGIGRFQGLNCPDPDVHDWTSLCRTASSILATGAMGRRNGAAQWIGKRERRVGPGHAQHSFAATWLKGAGALFDLSQIGSALRLFQSAASSCRSSLGLDRIMRARSLFLRHCGPGIRCPHFLELLQPNFHLDFGCEIADSNSLFAGAHKRAAIKGSRRSTDMLRISGLTFTWPTSLAADP